MMRMLIRKSLAAIFLSAAVGSIAAVPGDETLGPGLDAVKARFPEIEIRHVEAEEEDGVVVREFELRDGDAGIEVEVGPDGRILEIEAAVTAADLPKPVADLVGSRHPGQPIREVEKIVRFLNREETRYVVVVEADGRTVEIESAPDGRLLEVDEDEDDDYGGEPAPAEPEGGRPAA